MTFTKTTNMSREKMFGEAFERLRSDKGIHNYAPIYALLPEDIESIFEMGVYWGGSLVAYEELFPMAKIYGMDIDLSLVDNHRCLESPRIRLLQGDVRDFDESRLPLGFDLVIDDCTHEIDHILSMWKKMYTRVRKFYIVEDVYTSRMMTIWQQIISDVPKAQVIFWRTSDHCGDDRILPDSDSQCIIVKF